MCGGGASAESTYMYKQEKRGAQQQAKGVSVQKVCSSRLWPSRVESIPEVCTVRNVNISAQNGGWCCAHGCISVCPELRHTPTCTTLPAPASPRLPLPRADRRPPVRPAAGCPHTAPGGPCRSKDGFKRRGGD